MRALQADDLYADWRGTDNYYFTYTLHTYNQLVWCSNFDGQFRAAIEASEAIMRNTPRAVLERCPDFVEPLMADVWYVLVRFGRWAAILDRATPESPVALAAALWAKSVASAATGHVPEALGLQAEFRQAVDSVPDT